MSDPFLGVSRSVTGRSWRLRPADEAVAQALGRQFGMSEPLARAICARGVGERDAESYLNPTLRALFPNPSSFAGMDDAARLLVDILLEKQKLMVFADYDVDGATSAALLMRWFRAMGHEIGFYVPDRLTEGYGPSPAAFRRLKGEGADMVVTVDCGAAAHDALAAAEEIGLPIIVIDHHLMRGAPPPAAALVNPNNPDCGSGQGNLAAAGVTFVLLAALNREARARGLFGAREEPDIRRWLDLAALGAICDVTQLTGFNRALTQQGLRVMSDWANPGLRALAEVAGTGGQATTFHAGFILGPRINAGGRIGRPDLGARLLATDDAVEAAQIAGELNALNIERKAIEQAVADEAARQIEHQTNFDPLAPVIVVAADDWHPGVIGIVAGRLRERYRKPVIVIGNDRAANIGKGSGRSQPGVNLGLAVQAAFDEGLLLAGGGHAMAAGLTIRPDRVPDLRDFLTERLAGEQFEAAAADVVDIDSVVSARSATRALLNEFEKLAPFGPGNPEPAFALSGVRVERPTPMRGGHVRVNLIDETGARLKAVAWRAEDTALGRLLKSAPGGIAVAGKLKADDWRGANGVQLEIEDASDPRQSVQEPV
jgi:single-stranded-DNA-specific exonuclease